MIASAASTIAVAVVAVVVVLTCVTFGSGPVTFASIRAIGPWLFDAVVSESHFALLAIAFDVVVLGIIGFGGLPWLEAAKLWHRCLAGIRHRCRQYRDIR